MAPKPMRQKDMATAGTLFRYRAIMGDVLTASMAVKSRNRIFSFS
jgi:hypothetical protein